jgi:glycerol-3-phosphate dehydrogenase (NAD(P)+)
MRLAVVGAGAWGTTVASMLATRNETVVWAREPEVADAINLRGENDVYLPGVALHPALRATAELRAAVQTAELVALAVPAQHVRAVAKRLAGLLPRDAPLVSLAKGIEQETARRPTEVLAEEIPHCDHARIGVLCGPNLAREVAAGQPAATVVAMPDPAGARALQHCLMSDRFRVYTSDDVVGCEIGGAVKNVIAIAAGMADGLGYGWNTRAALITRGLAELTRLGVALGGQPLTFLGLAGNGDLIATCSSAESRNHRVGVALAEGRSVQEILAGQLAVAEGVATAPALLSLADRAGVEMPIAQEVLNVLRGTHTPAETLALMTRAPTTELHHLRPR